MPFYDFSIEEEIGIDGEPWSVTARKVQSWKMVFSPQLINDHDPDPMGWFLFGESGEENLQKPKQTQAKLHPKERLKHFSRSGDPFYARRSYDAWDCMILPQTARREGGKDTSE